MGLAETYFPIPVGIKMYNTQRIKYYHCKFAL